MRSPARREAQIDADLGGGVIKQRLARPEQGKSVFMYGFPKSHRDNIDADEETQFKEAAKHVLALTEKQLAALVSEGDFVEVETT